MSTSVPEQHELAVFIGRFQPFHSGHLGLLTRALQQAAQVVVVLGSSFHARTAKNPFTWQERAAMIAAAVDDSLRERISFVAVRDYYDDQRWAAAVRNAVQKRFPEAKDIALVGHHKDTSSRYLNYFPQWQLLAFESMGDIDATRVRAVYFEAENMDVSLSVLGDMLPAPIRHYLRAWSLLPFYADLVAEHKMMQKYKDAWKAAPYPPIFCTVDAVVQTAGHVLLIERGQFPGKGLWALPGGFLDPHERLLQGAVRELLEETRLGVLQSSLLDAFVSVQVFDHPERSLRGRTITHAHLFNLQTEQLPDIEADDDASQARWVPMQDLAAMEARFFDDHFHILDHFFRLSVDDQGQIN